MDLNIPLHNMHILQYLAKSMKPIRISKVEAIRKKSLFFLTIVLHQLGATTFTTLTWFTTSKNCYMPCKSLFLPFNQSLKYISQNFGSDLSSDLTIFLTCNITIEYVILVHTVCGRCYSPIFFIN